MKDETDPFDLENLRVPEELLRQGAQKTPQRATKPKRAQFAMFPLALAPHLAGSGEATIMVAIYLLHQDWKRKGQPVTLSNAALKEWGVSRLAKCRALRELEMRGLVVIERSGNKSPRVTWAQVFPG